MAHPLTTLRPATAGDVGALEALARDPAVAPFISGRAVDALRPALADPDQSVLVASADGVFAGGARLVVVHPGSALHEIRSMMLVPGLRGRGFGTAFVRALTAQAFSAGAHRVQAEVLGFNTAALAAFERAGFTREGVRRSAWRRDGGWHDGVHLGVLAEEFVSS